MGTILLAPKRRLWFIVTTTGIVFLCGAYLEFIARSKPLAPAVPVVSGCEAVNPGIRRIGEQYGFQFDLPEERFDITEGTSDTAPPTHGFDLRPKGSASYLVISSGPQETMRGVPVPPDIVFSEHVEKRNIVDDKGHVIGEDDWGYLKSGERWRQIHLLGFVNVKYGPANERDAVLFDRVISSACLIAQGP